MYSAAHLQKICLRHLAGVKSLQHALVRFVKKILEAW
jgi:hypothetical protein